MAQDDPQLKLKEGYDSHMAVVDHLSDLRRCIISALLAVLAGAAVSFFFLDLLMELFFAPLGEFGKESLFFFSPYEAFFIHIKLALFGGVVLGMPMILWQLWRFMAPALLENERSMVIGAILFSSLLFISGILFAYYMVLPFSLKFLLSFETSFFQAMLSAEKYIRFVVMLLLAFGMMFLLPIVLLCLHKMGIVSLALLRKHRKLAFVVILFLSAIMTPPDVITQGMLTIPIYGLYELSILLIWWSDRKHYHHDPS